MKFCSRMLALRPFMWKNNCDAAAIHSAAISHVHSRLCSATVKDEATSIVGENNVSSSEAVREQHGQDEGPHAGHAPDLVVWPTSTEQVSQIAKLCYSRNIPMVPFGTGTGLESGISALRGGICMDLSKMDRIVNFNPSDFDVTVEPGVTRKTLNHHIKDEGLWFPVDPGADASLCGMASTSASGTNAVKYGTMRENVMNLEVVLPHGEILYTAGRGRRPKKSSAGYNLTNLFVGSEGTLGIITKTTLRLYAIPETMASAVCAFPSIAAAVATTVETLQSSIPIARIEFLDEMSMKACNKYSHLSYAEQPSLFLEFHGSPSEVQTHAELVGELAKGNGGTDFMWSTETEERNRLWKARHELYYAVGNLRPGCRQYLTDVCVPVSNLKEAVTFAKKEMINEGIIGAVLGHVGDGNFHCNLTFDPNDEKEFKLCEKIAFRIAKKALALQGTCTGEHGIGVGKMSLLEEEVGPVGTQVMKQLKTMFDPKNLMNPGKILHLP